MEKDHIPLIDVRSPIEYNRGHIPNAINLPLFSDEERAEIGTIYKKQGQEQAIDRGLAIAGSKMQSYVNTLKTICSEKEIAIHCWRGGRRSSSMAWLFSFVGYQVHLIEKGYKAYRNYVLKMLGKVDIDIVVLGGKTGSGKTEILHALRSAGEQVIDLEALANHKGSAFGAIEEDDQPSSEFFENKLYDDLRGLDFSKRIWVENESKGIGRVYIPDPFWGKMKKASLIHLEIPLEERARYLSETYGKYSHSELKKSFQAIQKKLGGLALKQAIEHIDNQDYISAAKIALRYYDKAYKHGLDSNTSPDISILAIDKIDPKNISSKLIKHINVRK